MALPTSLIEGKFLGQLLGGAFLASDVIGVQVGEVHDLRGGNFLD